MKLLDSGGTYFVMWVTSTTVLLLKRSGEENCIYFNWIRSRVLGPEFGGSIGVIFTIANAMDSSLNAVGFAQTVQDMMKEYGGLIIVDGADNDIRIIGTVTMFFICTLCGLGSYYETKVLFCRYKTILRKIYKICK